MIEFHRASFGTEMNGKGMSHLVSGVRVQTINLGDWKTVKEVARVNAKQRRFFAAELGEVSVEEYSSEVSCCSSWVRIQLIEARGRIQHCSAVPRLTSR